MGMTLFAKECAGLLSTADRRRKVRSATIRPSQFDTLTSLCCMPLIATGENDAEVAQNMPALRRGIARYASTRTYQPIFEQHDWAGLVPKLHAMSEQAKWEEMGDEINDEIADTIGIVATYDRLADRIKARWAGMACRVALRLPFHTAADEDRLRALASALGA